MSMFEQVHEDLGSADMRAREQVNKSRESQLASRTTKYRFSVPHFMHRFVAVLCSLFLFLVVHIACAYLRMKLIIMISV